MASKEPDAFSKDLNEAINLVLQPMIMVIFLLMFIPALPITQAAQRYFGSQMYEGQTIPKVLDATPILKFIDFIADEPFTGLISATLHNDGWVVGDVHYAWSAFIGINNQDELHELRSGEDYYIDMAGADRRIEQIFYKANLGQKATVRLIGKY